MFCIDKPESQFGPQLSLIGQLILSSSTHVPFLCVATSLNNGQRIDSIKGKTLSSE